MTQTEAPIFNPGEIGAMTGIAPEALRNWRTRGFMANYGAETDGGRWVYSLRDLVAFWISERLTSRRTVDRHTALAISWSEAENMIGFIVQIHEGLELSGLRYVVLVESAKFDEDGEIRMNGTSLVKCKALSEIEPMTFDRVEVIDLFNLARTAPPKIRDVVLKGNEAS